MSDTENDRMLHPSKLFMHNGCKTYAKCGMVVYKNATLADDLGMYPKGMECTVSFHWDRMELEIICIDDNDNTDTFVVSPGDWNSIMCKPESP